MWCSFGIVWKMTPYMAILVRQNLHVFKCFSSGRRNESENLAGIKKVKLWTIVRGSHTQCPLSGEHSAGEPRAFRPDKTPFKWSFPVRKARHPPATRSFSRRPRLHFPVDLSSAQHHAQAPKIADTLSHPTDHSQLRLFSCRIGGSTSHSYTRCHSIVTKSVLTISAAGIWLGTLCLRLHDRQCTHYANPFHSHHTKTSSLWRIHFPVIKWRHSLYEAPTTRTQRWTSVQKRTLAKTSNRSFSSAWVAWNIS